MLGVGAGLRLRLGLIPEPGLIPGEPTSPAFASSCMCGGSARSRDAMNSLASSSRSVASQRSINPSP